MAENWPASLPSSPSLNGFSGEVGEGAVRTAMEQGPIRNRQRFKNVPDSMQFSFRMTAAQFKTFVDFWDITLAGGTKPFVIEALFDGEVKSGTVQAIRKYGYSGISGGRFAVSFLVQTI